MHAIAPKAPYCDFVGSQRGKGGQQQRLPTTTHTAEMALHREHPPQGQERHHRSSRATVARVNRRRGSREQALASSRRKSYFLVCSLTIVVALACYGWLPGSRSLPPRESATAAAAVPAARDTTTLVRPRPDNRSSLPAETQEAKLRREISVLEESLQRKKALLGIATDVPLDSSLDADSNPHAAGVGGGVEGSSVFDSTRGGTTTTVNVHIPGADHSSPYENPSSPRAGARLGAGVGVGVMAGEGAGGAASSAEHPKGVAGHAMFGENPVRPTLESKSDLIREAVPLIVGGTDGSGTRGVVALLQRLKVAMVVEDTGTMDIHASPYMVKGGWPEVVRPVLEWAHGAGYDTQAAPSELRKTTIAAMGKLRAQMDKSAVKLHRQAKEEGAQHVCWGFKAPVSMLLVPFFAEAWGKAKFLHVVRDGRDIAFSGNQTPVSKFYQETFPKGSREGNMDKAPLKAITMWNAWNVGLYQWAASELERGATGLDYLLLHTEDLIDPEAKFAAIKDVAEFVGSPLSDFELCCIATEGSKDMGSHTASRKDRGQITSRFGKWKTKVEGDPDLARKLQNEGERGLSIFGYQPERSLRVSGGFHCGAEHDPTCPKPPSAQSRSTSPRQSVQRKNTQVPADTADTATCVGLSKHVDYKGFDLLVGLAEEHLDCCRECRKVSGCTHFTFDYKSGNCYLKSGKGAENAKGGLVSGAVVAP